MTEARAGEGGGVVVVGEDGATKKEVPVHTVFGRPHWFADVGKVAKDLLYKGFSSGSMLSVSCLAPGGLFLSSTATMIEGSVVGLMSTSFKSGGTQTELSTNTLNQVTAGTTYDNIAPGLKIALTTTLPGAGDLGKAQVHYQLNNAALDATVFGFRNKPVVQVSANVGSERLAFGCSSVYDTESNKLSNTRLGLEYLQPNFSASFLYDPFKDNVLDAYATYAVNRATVVAGHMHHKLEKQVTSTTLGASHRLDPFTVVKGRLSNEGLLGAVFEHQANPSVLFGVYAEVDTTNLQRKPGLGINVSILTATS